MFLNAALEHPLWNALDPILRAAWRCQRSSTADKYHYIWKWFKIIERKPVKSFRKCWSISASTTRGRSQSGRISTVGQGQGCAREWRERFGAQAQMSEYLTWYFPIVDFRNSSIDGSHKAGFRTATFYQLSDRFQLANSWIFVTHAFFLPPTLFAHGCDSNVFFFFVPAPFCRRIAVLDCCTGQSPGKGNEMTVVLVSLQATKWLFYWSVSRLGEGGGQIQAMLFKRGLGFGGGQWALVACGRGIRYVVGGSHPRCCGLMCPRITSLRQGRWRWHGQGGQPWRLDARVLGSGGLWHGRVGGGTLQLLRSNGLQFQLQKRPSGSDLAGQVLGRSVLWTFAHPGVPCQRIVLCVVGVQPGWCGGKQWWCRWPTGFLPKEVNHLLWLQYVGCRCGGLWGCWDLKVGCV